MEAAGTTAVRTAEGEQARTPAEEAGEQALARARAAAEGDAEALPALEDERAAEPEQDGEAGEDQARSARDGTLARAQRLVAETARPDIEVDDEYIAARDAIVSGDPTPEDWERAEEWFLSDEPEEVNTRFLWVRVGGSDEKPRRVPWAIAAIPTETIRAAEREARNTGNRAARRGAPQESTYDEVRANLRVVVEGTVKPDIRALARERKGVGDAIVILQGKLRHRPGVIAQLAAEIMSISGFDQEDVRAAGN